MNSGNEYFGASTRPVRADMPFLASNTRYRRLSMEKPLRPMPFSRKDQQNAESPRCNIKCRRKELPASSKISRLKAIEIKPEFHRYDELSVYDHAPPILRLAGSTWPATHRDDYFASPLHRRKAGSPTSYRPRLRRYLISFGESWDHHCREARAITLMPGPQFSRTL